MEALCLILVLPLIPILAYAKFGVECLDMVMSCLGLFLLSVILFYSIYFSDRIGNIEDIQELASLAERVDQTLLDEIVRVQKCFDLLTLYKMLLSTQWLPHACEQYMKVPNKEFIGDEDKKQVLILFRQVLEAFRALITQHLGDGRSLQTLCTTVLPAMVDAARTLGDRLAHKDLIARLVAEGRLCNEQGVQQAITDLKEHLSESDRQLITDTLLALHPA